MKIISNGTYTINYNNIQYEFNGGNVYNIDDDTAKYFVDIGYCLYENLENETKSKKTSKNIE
jgi:hypothetical protein